MVGKKQMEKKARQSNFELMRILAMFLIVMYHAVLHAELADGTPLVFAPFSVNQAFSYLVGMWGLTGVGCFFLLTAYFQIPEGKVRSKRLLLLLLQTVFIAAVAEIFVIVALRKRAVTAADVIHILVSPFWGNYWFITAYLALMFLSPFLNRIIESLDDRVYRKLLIVFTLVSPLYSTFGDTRQTLCDLSIGVYYYLLWGYLRKHPGNCIERHRVPVFIGTLLFCVGSACLSSWYFTRAGKQAAGLFTIFGRASILQVILAVSLFYMFRNWNIGSKGWINFPAKGMLGVYLIHENQLLFPFLWNWILFIRDGFTDSAVYPLHLLGCVGLVFILSTAADLIRLYVLERPLSKLLDPLDPLFQKLDYWFNIYIYI